MSPNINICQEPALAVHAQSQTASGSHSQAREDLSPHFGTEFFHRACASSAYMSRMKATRGGSRPMMFGVGEKNEACAHQTH